MKREFNIESGLLLAIIQEVKTKRLPVHIQRGMKFTDENGSEQECVIIEHPDTDFDLNGLLSRVINEHYNLKQKA